MGDVRFGGLSLPIIVLLLEFCINNTYFSFHGQFYEQVEGTAMGSPVGIIVANFYMEYFEQNALSTATTPLEYGSGMWMIHLSLKREDHKLNFLEHINSVDPAIRFTVEDNKEDGAIPFLDSIVKPEANGRLFTTVYRKPTHMGQYLQWDSHHHLSAKYSVRNIFNPRA